MLSDKELVSLPPPSSLFKSNTYSNGTHYVLPPPSSLPGYHLPPLKRRRSSFIEESNQKRKQIPTFSDTKTNSVATTLASLSSKEEVECIQLESCKGQGGSFECCGLNFKHLNCLQRHSWIHTDLHQKLTIQQETQLLEAAQILMDIARYGMNKKSLLES